MLTIFIPYDIVYIYIFTFVFKQKKVLRTITNLPHRHAYFQCCFRSSIYVTHSGSTSTYGKSVRLHAVSDRAIDSTYVIIIDASEVPESDVDMLMFGNVKSPRTICGTYSCFYGHRISQVADSAARY